MTAVAEIVRRAHDAGVRLSIDGGDIIAESDKALPRHVVEMLRVHKPELLNFLTSHGGWNADDWIMFHDERIAIAVRDGGLTEKDAQVQVVEDCVREWLARNRELNDGEACLWCKKPDKVGRPILPFWHSPGAHSWLHAECWKPWDQRRRDEARKFLANIGISDEVARNVA